jgi:hypothetical protein
MSKSRKRREREKQEPPRPPPPKPKRAWTLASKLFAGILAFCTLLGVIALWPRVTIEAEGQVDPSKPYPISFKITNTGFVPLRDVQPFVGICRFWIGEPKNLPEACAGSLSSGFIMPQWRIKWLARDEPTKIRLDDLLAIAGTAKFGAADISVGVKFYIWIIPWLYVPIEYRFQTRLERDGKLSWMPRPLDK